MKMFLTQSFTAGERIYWAPGWAQVDGLELGGECTALTRFRERPSSLEASALLPSLDPLSWTPDQIGNQLQPTGLLGVLRLHVSMLADAS